jgi:hypothetical protein
MDKVVGIADFIRNPRESFRRFENERLSGIRAASLCFVLARIYGQPYLKKLEELDDKPLGVEYYGQTCHTIVSINGITIPWLFTRETALRAATLINLPGSCEELEQFSLRIIERGNHKVVAELAYILAFRAMLKDQPERWNSFAEDCRVAMEKCTFNAYEDCVPSHGPLAHGVPMPNWFHPATVLPRLGLPIPPSA